MSVNYEQCSLPTPTNLSISLTPTISEPAGMFSASVCAEQSSGSADDIMIIYGLDRGRMYQDVLVRRCVFGRPIYSERATDFNANQPLRSIYRKSTL